VGGWFAWRYGGLVEFGPFCKPQREWAACRADAPVKLIVWYAIDGGFASGFYRLVPPEKQKLWWGTDVVVPAAQAVGGRSVQGQPCGALPNAPKKKSACGTFVAMLPPQAIAQSQRPGRQGRSKASLKIGLANVDGRWRLFFCCFVNYIY